MNNTLPINTKQQSFIKSQPQQNNVGVQKYTPLTPEQLKQIQDQLIQNPTPYMNKYKPGIIPRVRAYFTNLTEIVKGSVSGMLYGVSAGIPAAGAAMLLVGKGASSALSRTKIGEGVLLASTLGGLLSGAFAGQKKNLVDTIKSGGVGLLYGASAGIPSAIVAAALAKSKGGNVAKAVFITATAVNTIIGAYVGKLIANGKRANIYMQHGAVENLISKK